MCLSHGYIPKFLNLHKLLAQKVGAADSDSVAGKPISTQSEVKVQSTSLFIFSSCNSFLHSPRHLRVCSIKAIHFTAEAGKQCRQKAHRAVLQKLFAA